MLDTQALNRRISAARASAPGFYDPVTHIVQVRQNSKIYYGYRSLPQGHSTIPVLQPVTAKKK